MKHRQARLGKLIREELGKAIIREIEFVGALPTVTSVDLDPKLETAKVGISVWPSEEAPRVLAELAKGGRALRNAVMKRVRIKYMPRFVFEIDHGHENAAAVEKLLLEEAQSGRLPPEDETA
jgi:ribosome-binding factor A